MRVEGHKAKILHLLNAVCRKFAEGLHEQDLNLSKKSTIIASSRDLADSIIKAFRAQGIEIQSASSAPDLRPAPQCACVECRQPRGQIWQVGRPTPRMRLRSVENDRTLNAHVSLHP